MLQQAIEHMGITGFAQIALVLFVSVFVSVLVREKFRSTGEVKHMSNLPLDNDDNGAIHEG
ncbi:MAG TPA: CcoQ/FixQ family Cbb3-type cytochrome c oxidase assembly chaperone [Phycisphaerae bacterium]|nr:CcoQ/FixQ family Cbb3-type cytochrome c oxidase assembly chaperone [Phycisphaerae bacterium]